MSCFVCNLNDSLTCSKCINYSISSQISKLKQLRLLQEQKKSVLSSLLVQIPQSKCKSLQIQNTISHKKSKLQKDRGLLETLKSSYKLKKQEIKQKEDEVLEISLAYTSIPNIKAQIQGLEKIRKGLIKKAVEIYERNAYFPEYCISEMFKQEKCLRYSQIIQDKDAHVSVDKPNFIICLKSKENLDMIVSYQSEEHNQAVNYSIAQISFCIKLIALILNFKLPFKLKYMYNFFQVKDFSGTRLAMNIYEPYECENALIYLYENLKILQQQAGVDFKKLKGVFDILSLCESEFTGQYFSVPSCLPEAETAINLEEENKIDEEVEEEWDLLNDSD